MKIRINGKDAEVPDALSVSDLLVVQEVKMPDMVSVELNGEILNRSAFGTTVIKENDGVEFLYFMGGGAERREVMGDRGWVVGDPTSDTS